MTFVVFSLIYFFLKAPILVLTLIKRAPRSPPTIPKIIGLWIYLRSILLTDARSANLILWSTIILFPYYNCLRIEIVNVLTAEQKKVLHNISKDQNVVGFESSYENRHPPIGAPNAALTPADIPAATNSLLETSF